MRLKLLPKVTFKDLTCSCRLVENTSSLGLAQSLLEARLGLTF